MTTFLDKIGLQRLWDAITSLFATKTEVAARTTARIYYGTCSTTASYVAKVATTETFPTVAYDDNGTTKYKPESGTVVGIKYSATNTYKTAGSTHTLEVNSTGAWPMYYNNAELATTTSANTLVAGYKNRYVFYMFNGTQWVFLAASYDANSTYSAMTLAEIEAGTGTTGRTMTPKILRENFYTETECNTNFATAVSYDSETKKIQYTKNSTATDVVTLASVATSGSYNDLSNTPTIPTKVSDLDNDSGFTTNTGTLTGVKFNNTDATVSNGVASITASLGDTNVIEAITFNGNSVSVSNKTAAITATLGDANVIETVKVNGSALTPSNKAVDITVPSVPTISTDISSDATSDTKTASPKAVKTFVEGKGYTTNTGTITSVKMNGSTVASSGEADLGTVLTQHQDISGKADKVTEVSHGTSDTTFAITPNILHKWGTINSLTLTYASTTGSDVKGYWFKFTAGSSFTALTLPTGVVWAAEPEIEEGKTYEVLIVDSLATYTTEGIDDNFATRTWVQNNYQQTLASGTNIKTINNESILGSGNITISSSGGNVSSTSVDTVVLISESDYENLGTKDSSTLYLIPVS